MKSFGDRAKLSHIAQLDRLLSEAGSVAAQWQNAVFRRHGSREAARLFLPAADEIGSARHFAARSLRDCMRALDAASNDASRQHISSAMRELLRAIHADTPAPKHEVETSTLYWIER